MTIWLTSDHHFSHANIIKYCDRPFHSVGEMDAQMIANHNAVVQTKDMVYHLGDFTFNRADLAKEYMEKLHGKFTLIRGNHDKWANRLSVADWPGNLQEVCDYKEVKFEGQKLILFHYPVERWNGCHHGSIHFHGHSHGKCKSEGMRRMDVGVDSNNYCPVRLTKELLTVMEAKNPLAFREK